MNGKFQWLIFFYIHEISEYKHYIEQFIKDFANFKGVNTKQIAIILLRELITLSPEKEFTFSYHLSSFETVGYKLVEKPIIARDPSRTKRLSNEELLCIFKEKVFKCYNAEKKILITFSHSNGFAINRDKEKINHPGLPKQNKSLFFNKSDFNLPNSSNKLTFSPEQGEYFAIKTTERDFQKLKNLLWISDLAKILDGSLPKNEKIDLLLMVNCNMQLIESLFFLQNKVKFIIASQTQFSFYGFHYKALLDTLRDFNDISSKSLSIDICNKYIELFTYKLPDGLEINASNSLFVHDLFYFDEVHELLNKLGKFLIKNIKFSKFKADLLYIRGNLIQDVTNYSKSALDQNQIDLGCLITTLQKLHLNEAFQKKIELYLEEYRLIQKKMNLFSYVGSEYILTDSYREVKYNLSGLSVYFPPDKDSFKKNKAAIEFYNQKQNLFIKNSFWDNFLKKLFK